MVPYIAHLISPELQELFRATVRIVDAIPEDVPRENGTSIRISCHHVARVVVHHIPDLRVVDGHFIKGYEHSWLDTPDPRFIIDPYPYALYSGPIILAVEGLSPWRTLYRTEQLPTGPSRAGFQPDLERILQAVAQNLS